jgi:ribosomal protein S18 acetylase RimI-like enzyme
MKNLKLRLARDDDDKFLFNLFYDVRAREFTDAGIPLAQLMPILELQHKAQIYSYSNEFPSATNSIIVFNEKCVGRILIQKNEKSAHLIDIAILQEFRGKGLGSFLINKMKSECDQIRLSVYAANILAIKFYEKHLFQISKNDVMYLNMEWNKC